MKKRTINDICYLSIQFDYNKDDLQDRFDGKHGKGQQLLVELMLDWDIEFIEAIINGKKLLKLYEVDYLTIEFAEKRFEYRKGQIKNWKSQGKIDLRTGICNTPECYLYWKESQIQTQESLKNFFPKLATDNKVFEPVPARCDMCPLRNSCIRLKI